MKRDALLTCAILIAAGVAVAAPEAHADPVVITTIFVETIVVATDTFETADGTVVATSSGVGYSDWLSPTIAADLAGDTTLPLELRSIASLVPQVSEYQFLAEQSPGDYIVSGSGGTIISNVPDIVNYLYYDFMAPGGLYSLVSVTPVTVGSASYNTGALEPNGDLIEGTVTFDVYDLNVVEQQVAAVPEPSSLALFGAGLVTLIPFLAWQRNRRAPGSQLPSLSRGRSRSLDQAAAAAAIVSAILLGT